MFARGRQEEIAIVKIIVHKQIVLSYYYIYIAKENEYY